ncbi:formylglycine-generating enzyme family protein [Bdellovibrio svalbardensis]|uniref:Formylglycine-generating enzyme family protein n=1 Tax=Bdellovibrio svalbardensis TaxID=2972972 RepID=A0ABT6DJF2_9BACT|nr:formylglycine-generating enzyme family protein [Bdellovibrio svalbardensis]MDG0816906.1 formylglycine-generating enzyme family protein [Bdellovibrio svalbardensis]
MSINFDIRKLALFFLLVSPLCTSAKELVPVPAGEFKMPAVLNKKSIAVASFQIDEHAVTNREYLEFVKAVPEWRKSRVKKIFADASYLNYWKRDDDFGKVALPQSPAVQVSWYAARAYCQWVGKRLPSINEWEYVASAPLKNQGDIKSVILEWYGKGTEWPLPVVKKKSLNSLGVYDMHGVIWEWVEDFNSSLVTGESRADGSLDKNLFCGAGASGAADPSDYAAFMRFAFRSSLQARYTVQNLGFRCAKDIVELNTEKNAEK